MASKANIFHDYSFGSAHSRPRQISYRREEPVELPRTSIWRVGAGALATALAMGALVVGSTYVAFREAPPQLLAETEALPPMETWQPDAGSNGARVINMLQGPALSVPEKTTPFVQTETEADMPSASAESTSVESRAPESRALIVDDSKPYPPTPAAAAPYPNPTTTPPDAIAPPATNAGLPAPAHDPENPYQD